MVLVEVGLGLRVVAKAQREIEAAMAAEIFGWHERRRETAAQRRLQALGVRIVPFSADNVAALFARAAPSPRAKVA